MSKSQIGKSPAFRFYSADFVMDTQSWTAEEVGVYVRLLCSEWVNGSIPPMPDADSTANGTANGTAIAEPMASVKRAPNRLALIAGVSEDTLRLVWRQVGEKFSKGENGNLVNARLEHEREMQAAYRDGKSNAGKTGAEKRWNSSRTGLTDSRANGKRIAQPMAQPMANDSCSSSSSSSFSSSFSIKEKQGACSASKDEELPVWESEEEHRERVMREDVSAITKQEEEQNVEQIWAKVEETPEGAKIVSDLLGYCRPNTGRRGGMGSK